MWTGRGLAVTALLVVLAFTTPCAAKSELEEMESVLDAPYAPRVPPPSPAYTRYGKAKFAEGEKQELPDTGEATLSPNMAAAKYGFTFGDLFALGILHNTMPNFKLPPGVSVPMMAGPAHLLSQRALNVVPHQLPDTSQLRAINAAVGTFRDPTGFTRQHSEHPKFPSYANYLKHWYDQYHVGQGHVGEAFATPHFPQQLGSGVDMFARFRPWMTQGFPLAGAMF